MVLFILWTYDCIIYIFALRVSRKEKEEKEVKKERTDASNATAKGKTLRRKESERKNYGDDNDCHVNADDNKDDAKYYLFLE